MNEDISERKKFMAPVMVPTCERATAFCSETTLTGNAVPRPSAKIDSSTSSAPERQRRERQRSSPSTAAHDGADDRDPLVVPGAGHGPAGDRRAAGRDRRQRNQRQARPRWR